MGRLAVGDRDILSPAVDMYKATGRWGLSGEVACAVLLLGSDDSSYLTGGEITVDGGLGQI